MCGEVTAFSLNNAGKSPESDLFRQKDLEKLHFCIKNDF